MTDKKRLLLNSEKSATIFPKEEATSFNNIVNKLYIINLMEISFFVFTKAYYVNAVGQSIF